MRASISALFIKSGAETACAAALLCSCGFRGSRGCCGNEDSPARAKGFESLVKPLGHNPRSWILECLEPNANRLKIVNDSRGKQSPARVGSYKKSGRKCIVHGQICELSKSWQTARPQTTEQD